MDFICIRALRSWAHKVRPTDRTASVLGWRKTRQKRQIGQKKRHKADGNIPGFLPVGVGSSMRRMLCRYGEHPFTMEEPGSSELTFARQESHYGPKYRLISASLPCLCWFQLTVGGKGREGVRRKDEVVYQRRRIGPGNNGADNGVHSLPDYS
jgi:hypothetical protein